jgi:predicted RNase H-like nuclease
MTRVAGVDGARDGCAAVVIDSGRASVQKVKALSEMFDRGAVFDIVAVDVPIGLLEAYETGGRPCDRAARKLLGKRASSVFPAPVRPALAASSYREACAKSRDSSDDRKAISVQTYAILRKIRECDELLHSRPELRDIVREAHPEVCFAEMAGRPLSHSKKRSQGRVERQRLLAQCFPIASDKVNDRDEDVLDAAAACWSALRLATQRGRSLVEPVPLDKTGLTMTIWV